MSNQPGPRGQRGERGPAGLPDDSLRQQVEALNITLAALHGKLNELITRDEVVNTYPNREETARIRRRVTFTIITSVLCAFAISMFANNYAITHCFLSPNSKQSTVCNTLFPGYNQAIEVGNARLAKFDDLLAQIPQNKAINAKQQAQLDKIQSLLEQIQKGQK